MIDEKSYNYFFDNKDRFMKQYNGRYLIIKDGELRACYADELAVEANARKHGEGLIILYLNPDGIKEYKLK